MLRGETVVLEHQDGTTERVDNVLVAQTDLTDLTVLDVQTRFINQARYKGDTSTLTLEWPKDNEGSLEGCHVVIRGERYRVYSDPMPYDDAVCPTAWNRSVTALRSLFLYDIDLVTTTPVRDEWGVTRDEYEYRAVKANWLRMASADDRVHNLNDIQHLVMFEVPLADYRGETLLRFQGEMYQATDTATAQDTIVMTCKAGVARG